MFSSSSDASFDHYLAEVYPTLAHTPETVSDLTSKLPGRGQDDGVDAIRIHSQGLKNGYGECQRFPLTSLCYTHTVQSSEDRGDTVGLNWTRP